MLLGVMADRSGTQLLAELRSDPAAAPLLERLPADITVHVVGGAVRDLLLGRRLVDLDLVVEGDAPALARRIDAATVRVHERFGTAEVELGGHEYDLAGARRERYPEPGALPEVEPAPLAEDLARRDFTVNAMALALSGPSPGRLAAYPGAREDLASKQLRILHDRSFRDDPTRLFRIARYASRLRFEIEPHTRDLASEAIAGQALQTVSGERIGAELRLLAQEPDPVAAFGAMSGLGLDDAVAPGFGVHDAALLGAALALLPPDGRGDLLVLGGAVAGIDAGAARALLEFLGFEAHDRETILAVGRNGSTAAHALESAASASEIAGVLASQPVEVAALAAALGAREPAQRWITELRHVRLAIDGRDLLAAGVPEGPGIGRGLRAALAAKLDGHAVDPAAELACALGSAREPDRDGG